MKALDCPATELFFGGARGGGKTDFLLADFAYGAYQYGSGWKGLLLRKSFGELFEIQERARQRYVDAEIKDKGTLYRFPNGAYLRLGYLESDNDVYRYQGQEFTWIGIDEIGNYNSDYSYNYLFGSLRSAEGVPTYMRCTGNPGGVGQTWVFNRFIKDMEPETIYEEVIEGQTISKCFIPSTIEDNPALMENSEIYLAALKKMPDYLYRAMRYGDWSLQIGSAISEWDPKVHVVPPRPLDGEQWRKFYSLDWGTAKPFSLGKWAVNDEGQFVRYGEWYGCDVNKQTGETIPNKGIGMGSSAVAERIWDMATNEGVSELIIDSKCFSTDDSDNASIASKFQNAGFLVTPSNKARVLGLAELHNLLMSEGSDGRRMLTVFSNCKEFIRTTPLLIPNKHHIEDIDTDCEDHIFDETRYAIMSDYNCKREPITGVRKVWNPLEQDGAYYENEFRRRNRQYV